MLPTFCATFVQTTRPALRARRPARGAPLGAALALVWGLAACSSPALQTDAALPVDPPRPALPEATVAAASATTPAATPQRRAPVLRVRPGDPAWGEFATTYSCRFRVVTIGRMGVGVRLTDGANVFDLDPVPSAVGQLFAGTGPMGTARVAFQGADVAVEVHGKALERCAPTRQWPMARFRATGNEPAWLLKGETDLLRWTIADKLFAVAADDGQPLALEQPLRMGNDPDAPLVSVHHRVCRDTATGMPHPYTVQLVFEGRALSGCGGEPASLLTGREWVVTGGSGAPVPPAAGVARAPSPEGHPVTIRFDGKGRVSGAAHCNLFTGIYALTGERLSVGSLAGTRRACPGTAMQDEHGFLRALETVVGFDVTTAGELTLITREAAERGVVAGIRAR